MAKIQLNGKKIRYKPKITIFDLLKRFKLNNKKSGDRSITELLFLKSNYKKNI